MRISRLLIVMTVLLLMLGGAQAKASSSVEPAKGEVEVKGTVAFTDGTRQQNVYGRCVTLERYNKYYAQGVPEQFDSAIKFGSEWHAGKDGAFKLSMVPGEYMLWAHGAKHKAVKITVKKGAKNVSVKVIGRTDNIISPFKLLTPDGEPVRNGSLRWGIRTDKEGVGAFRSEGYDPYPPYHHLFWVKDTGYAVMTINEDDLLRKDPKPVRLQKGTYVSGTVVSKSTGMPLGGVVIFPLRDRRESKQAEFAAWNELFGMDPYSMLSSSDKAAATSRDGDGFFTLGPLPPGDYGVLFTLPSAPDMEFHELLETPLHVVEGKTSEPLNVKVPINRTMRKLKGRVLDGRNNRPIANAMITVSVHSYYPSDDNTYVEHWYIWEPVVRHVKTDRNGEFTLYPLDPRKLVFDVAWNGLRVQKRLLVPSVEKTIDFTLKPAP